MVMDAAEDPELALWVVLTGTLPVPRDSLLGAPLKAAARGYLASADPDRANDADLNRNVERFVALTSSSSDAVPGHAREPHGSTDSAPERGRERDAARISMFDVLLADQLAGVTNLESAFVGDRENPKLPNVRFFFNRRCESRKIDVPLRRGEVLIAIQTWARNFDRKMSEGQYRMTQRRWEAAKRKLAHSWQESSTGYSQSCKSHSKTVLTSHRGV